ncbi:MAG: DUF2336 domain-containing protein [Nitratireductor sp.]
MLVERFIGWMDTAKVDDKAAATNALARAYLLSDMSTDEREATEATMTVLLDDPDISIRHALASAFAMETNAPRHIVLALAADILPISTQILSKSPVLLECELKNYVAKGKAEQQFAIACRPYISCSTAELIAELASNEACLAMLLNEGAELSNEAFKSIAVRFGDESDIRNCLLARADVPVGVRILLIEKYALTLMEGEGDANTPTTLSQNEKLQEVCDKATISYAAQVSDAEINEIVEALISTDRLNTSFLLRAICMGNIALFASALSALSGIELERVERVLADDRRSAFNAIYQRSDLPKEAFMVFDNALNNWRIALLNPKSEDAATLAYLVTKQTLATFQATHAISGPVVDQLLLLLRRICTNAARDSARNQVKTINERITAQALQLEHAAREEEQVELSNEEIQDFALNFADELAEGALEQEAELQEHQISLDASNLNENSKMHVTTNASKPLPLLADIEVAA